MINGTINRKVDNKIGRKIGGFGLACDAVVG